MPTKHSLDVTADLTSSRSAGRVSRYLRWIRLPTALDGASSAFTLVGTDEILEMVNVNNLESYEAVTAQAWARVGDSMRVAIRSRTSVDGT